jgi:hypothetical protein
VNVASVLFCVDRRNNAEGVGAMMAVPLHLHTCTTSLSAPPSVVVAGRFRHGWIRMIGFWLQQWRGFL